ncbi:hypothetical protein NLU13_2210 [Sarocladium strictum]|uniref:Carboxylesterase type B domain-containing protein n=1 Tax=Sarocladium strictum TaxID=5046 RepID=A0AA39GSE3_SARSR|nr:hypothetical protein NLU13_2210 [Sarocladium strictum]
MGRGPGGRPVNTDEEFKNALLPGLGGENTDESPEELAAELMKLYPNDQSVGIPSLETWPHVIQPGDSFAQQLGAQFRRVSSVFGDHFMHYARRRANLVWTDKNLPSYAYRFNVIPNGIPEFLGSLHFQEVAFVFLNLNGDGYAVNPFGQGNETYTTQARELSKAMGSAWVNFITGLDPNGAEGLPNGIIWPAYSASGKIGQDLVWDLGEKSVAESDDWRQEAMAWFIDHALSVFGD